MNRRSTSAISPQDQRAQQQAQARQRRVLHNSANPNADSNPNTRQGNGQQTPIDPAMQQAMQNQNSQYAQRVRAHQQQQLQMRRARQIQMAKQEEMAQAQAYFEQMQKGSMAQGSGFLKKLLNLMIVVIMAYGGYWLHRHHKFDGIYAMFKSNSDSVSGSTGSSNRVIANVSEADLEEIANQIIQTKSISGEMVDQYVAKWNKLSDTEKKEMMDSVWYQHFSFVVESRIRDYQRRVAFGSKHTSGDEMEKLQNASLPLMKIATAVGIVKKPLEESLSSKQERFKQMMAEVEKDIQSQRAVKEQERNEILQTSKLDSRSLSSSTPVKEQPRERVQSQGTVSKSATKSSTSEQNKPKTAAPSPAISIEKAVTQSDIDDVLSEYKLAYQNGDVDSLLTLFKDNKANNDSNRLAQLRENYATSFKLSRQRQIKLNNLKWEQHGSQLLGTGDYKETFKLGSGKDTREIHAKLTLELRSKSGQEQGAYIANFNLSDQTVTQIKSEAQEVNVSDISDLLNRKKPVAPTAAELQDLIAKFIRVWETGSTKDLTGLLAKDAKTNDKTNRDAIVKEYGNIFQSTYDREMYISNMQWETNGSFAKGRGILEAMSFSKEDDDIKNITGKIQIVAHREGNQVKITHLYHLSQDQ